MLDQWLNPTKVSSFARDYLRRQPYATPSSAARAMPIFGWDTLDRLLTRNPPDVLVLGRGKLLELPTPRTLDEALDLLTSGVGLVIRRAEKLDDGVAGLAASVTQHIPGDVHVQLIVTPAGTYGFGWHYDDEDVFIVQTEGSRTIFFGTIRWSVNGRQVRRRISLDSAVKPHRSALLGCWQVIGYTFQRAGGMRQNASRIHFRFPSAFSPSRSISAVSINESSDCGETVLCRMAPWLCRATQPLYMTGSVLRPGWKEDCY